MSNSNQPRYRYDDDDPANHPSHYDPHTTWLRQSLAETRRRHRRGWWLIWLVGVPLVLAGLVVLGILMEVLG